MPLPLTAGDATAYAPPSNYAVTLVYTKVEKLLDAITSWATSNGEAAVAAAAATQFGLLQSAYLLVVSQRTESTERASSLQTFGSFANPYRVFYNTLDSLGTTARNQCLNFISNVFGSRQLITYLDGQTEIGRTEEAMMWFISWVCNMLHLQPLIE